jgi:hypothetical protein
MTDLCGEKINKNISNHPSLFYNLEGHNIEAHDLEVL